MPMNPRLLRPTQGGFSSPDADARAYLAAVRQADGANLEPAVAKAISDFVIGCKTDGIWNAIKASCILMGARTLSGALTPLKGGAPTNVSNNFVSGDYNRKTGLVGDASTKYLASGRNNNSDPQDNKHISSYKTVQSSGNGGLIGTNGTGNGRSWLFNSLGASGSTLRINASSSVVGLTFAATGFMGATRNASGTLTHRISAASTSVSSTSATPDAQEIDVFRAAGAQYTDARLAFYSIGENVDLALLDTRVSSLYTAIGAAIP